ncbi:peptidase inhibitor family I36 protein [Streptomyces sp. NPDC056347]|uniref:peptidase inhibitor family I36 protein n=1 Tax=Streptomyces sp. NPDC056347 TaxID=3345790 RepID=UPI0035DBF4B1
MENVRGRRPKLLAGAAAAAALAAFVVPSSASAAPDAWQCTPGTFCAYSGANGSGQVCGWTYEDPDWTNGSSRCKWVTKTRVRSVYNAGTTGKSVSAYTGTKNTGTKVFCLGAGKKMNLSGSGTYLRSHTWKC